MYHGGGRRPAQASPDLVVLPGKRHLCVSEPNRGAKLDEALIKFVTGGEPVTVRKFYRGYFDFKPQFKMTISGNHRPEINDTSDGIWRRANLIPLPVQVPKEDVDDELGAKLRAEASGVLNQLLDGLRDWFDNGLVLSKSITDATAEYRSDSDLLARFLETCVVNELGSRVQSSEMHATFNAWAKTNGAIGSKEWSAKGLAAALKEKGYQSKHSNYMWWCDVKLIRTARDFVDAEGRPLRDDGGPPTGDSPPSQGGANEREIDF